jgi:flagellar hook-associated protein 1 FlgK
MTALANNGLQLPVFTDGMTAYTGTITAGRTQQAGFAGRITVNPQLILDPTKFSTYSTSPQTPAGDTARTDFLFTQLSTAQFYYSPTTGLGSGAQPYRGTVTSYLQQFITLQGNAAANALSLKQGQEVVVNTLQEKYNATSKVDIDSEMANLIALQNSYQANARVLSVVQNMMNALMAVQV